MDNEPKIRGFWENIDLLLTKSVNTIGTISNAVEKSASALERTAGTVEALAGTGEYLAQNHQAIVKVNGDTDHAIALLEAEQKKKDKIASFKEKYSIKEDIKIEIK